MGYHLLSRWHWLKHLRDFFWETRAWLRNVSYSWPRKRLLNTFGNKWFEFYFPKNWCRGTFNCKTEKKRVVFHTNIYKATRLYFKLNQFTLCHWLKHFCLFFHKKQLIDYEAVSGFIDNLGQPVLYGVFTSEFVFKADLFKKRVHSTECLGSKQPLTFTKFKLKPIFVSLIFYKSKNVSKKEWRWQNEQCCL